jgi:DNA-binding CsgD family transcriptional regulator
MATAPQSKLGSLPAMLRVTRGLETRAGGSATDKRRAVADFCRMLGERIGAVKARPAVGADLSPRMRQTLERLLSGDGEKQVAARLKLSPHTVHVYVKALYRHFDVSSRGELLAKCLGRR